MQTSRDRLFDELKELTRSRDPFGDNCFEASYFARRLNLSRSLTSQYLNALFAAGLVIKVQARPVLFFAKDELERRYRVSFEQTAFLSLEELNGYIQQHGNPEYRFDDVIGAPSGSLKRVVESAKSAVCYPSKGLPFLLVGAPGTGKHMLMEAISRYAVSLGVIDGRDRVVEIDVARSSAREAVDDALDALKHASMESKPLLVWVVNAQLLSGDDIMRLRSWFDAPGRKADSRLFISWEGTELAVEEQPWFCSFPVVCSMPLWHERPFDEREAYVYRAFRIESKMIGRPIEVEANVVRLLAERAFEGDIAELRTAVKLVCANALAEIGAGDDALKIYAYHIPCDSARLDIAHALTSSVLIDVSQVDPAGRCSGALSFLSELFQGIEMDPDDEDGHAGHALTAFLDEVSRHFEGKQIRESGFIVPVRTAVELMFSDMRLHEPIGFAAHLASTYLFFQDNPTAVSTWRQRDARAIQEGISFVRRRFAFEHNIMQHIASRLRDHLGWHIAPEVIAMFALYLHRFSSLNMTGSCRGIIAAHGASTATSMADAVNMMLNEHVFDALDMPFDSSSDEVIESLQNYLGHDPVALDVLVMVDMGSLEAIGKRLASSLEVSTGVINNVSTGLALEAGTLILDRLPLEQILERVRKQAGCSYTIERCARRGDCIVFTSENGSAAASRVANLFARSLPHPIDVAFITCDYFDFIEKQGHVDGTDGKNILFVLGVEPIDLPGINFLTFEEITNPSADGLYLDGYFSPSEMAEFTRNLLKNFSLENLVRNLTILEPNSLMDAVSRSVESLQQAMHARFSSRMTMRLYVHVGYLIERLVTKDTVDYDDADAFERSHAAFSRLVRSSFSNIARTYGVELPASEIAYLYDLIEIESPLDPDSVQGMTK